MSTDYHIEIRRCNDDKEVGKVMCNSIKNIIDSDVSHCINCTGYQVDGVKFRYGDLDAANHQVVSNIEMLFNQIHEKKMMICVASNIDIKHDLEDDILSLNEELQRNYVTLWAIGEIQGKINALVEDTIHEDGPAYELNAHDQKCNIENILPAIWSSDVYCVLKAS